MAKLFLNGKKFSPLLTRREKDMLQQRVDATNDASYLFYYFGGKNLDFINKLDTSKVTNMKYMFSNCNKLKTIDLSNFNTENVTDMSYMFSNCNKLQTIDLSNFNTSKVTDMSYMFNYCEELSPLNLSNFDTSKVTNMSNMFYRCRKLTELDVSSFNTSNVTDMGSMFYNLYNLETLNLSNFNTNKVTRARDMFQSCSHLKTLIIPDGFLKNITDATWLFNYCSALTNLDTTKLDFSNVTNAYYCFTYCKALNVIDLRFKTSKITNMEGMFSLGGIDNNLEQILGLDMYSCTKDTSLFNECKNLKELTIKNIRISIVISTNRIAVNLSRNSLLGVAKELWDNSGSSTAKTLTITTAHKTTLDGIYVKLVPITEEMRAEDPYIDNKKPFVECASTDEGAMTVSNYITVEKNWTITAS